MPLTRAALRAIDRRASEEYGIPGVVLMENAGRNAAEILHRLNPLRLRVAVACGPGNNGGDGCVIARHLDRLGIPVTVRLFCDAGRLAGDAAVNYNVVVRMGLVGSADLSFAGFGWIVDALFGTGLTRAIGPPHDAVVAAINASGSQVLAVDIPSGLDCDTGRPLGPTVRAHHTVSFVGLKEGFVSLESRALVGEVHFADIGAPRRLIDEYLQL